MRSDTRDTFCSLQTIRAPFLTSRSGQVAHAVDSTLVALPANDGSPKEGPARGAGARAKRQRA